MTSQQPPAEADHGNRHCTYAMDGYTIECYSFRVVAEVHTKTGERVAVLCSRHATPGARETAEIMNLIWTDL
jgi:hypothetical protein